MNIDKYLDKDIDTMKHDAIAISDNSHNGEINYPNTIKVQLLYINHNNEILHRKDTLTSNCTLINNTCLITSTDFQSLISTNKDTNDNKKYSLYKILLHYVHLSIENIINNDNDNDNNQFLQELSLTTEYIELKKSSSIFNQCHCLYIIYKEIIPYNLRHNKTVKRGNNKKMRKMTSKIIA
jgi:hypothetical protein